MGLNIQPYHVPKKTPSKLPSANSNGHTRVMSKGGTLMASLARNVVFVRKGSLRQQISQLRLQAGHITSNIHGTSHVPIIPTTQYTRVQTKLHGLRAKQPFEQGSWGSAGVLLPAAPPNLQPVPLSYRTEKNLATSPPPPRRHGTRQK